MKIRAAVPEDAAGICCILVRSVTDLCIGDHNNDPVILDKWLGNKTPETLALWISDPSSTILVAEEDDRLLAVGSVLNNGEIALNYVLPEARFRGVSRKMVEALEDCAVRQGNTTTTLFSTGTARRFYLSLGYEEIQAKDGLFGPVVYEMQKVQVNRNN